MIAALSPMEDDTPAPPTLAVVDSALVERAERDYAAPLTGYAAGFFSGDWDTARDVVQDVMLKLHQQPKEKREQFAAEPERLKPWLYRVARNRAIDLIRKSKPEDDIETGNFSSREPDPATAAEKKDEASALMAHVATLPDNQREVIRLKFQSDLSYKEIAELTDLSVSNIGFLLHTGLKTLRSRLESTV